MVPILIALSVAFAWAVVNNGGSEPAAWHVSMLVVAMASVLYLWRTARWSRAPRLKPALFWALLVLLAETLLQSAPLPASVIGALSPERAELAGFYAGVAGLPGQWIALSVVPATSFHQFLRIATCVLVFLLIREVCWSLDNRLWLAALPIVVVAAAEALLGLVQYYSGDSAAHGSYVNRNHFAGLLEMAAPLAIVCTVIVIRQRPPRALLGGALLGCVALSATLLILVALLHSLSRMGYFAGMASVLITGFGLISANRTDVVRAGVARLRRRAAWKGAALLSTCLLFFGLLPPDELVSRFGDRRNLPGEDRPELWSETASLIRAYPLFGCGLGGFESAFMRHKASAPLNTDDFAHNDYLQYLAELGLIGFCAIAVIAAALGRAAVRAATRHAGFQGRSVAVACIAAFAAIGLHSLVDFNLYIPANSMLLAWVAGMAGGVIFSSHPTSSPKVVESATLT